MDNVGDDAYIVPPQNTAVLRLFTIIVGDDAHKSPVFSLPEFSVQIILFNLRINRLSRLAFRVFQNFRFSRI